MSGHHFGKHSLENIYADNVTAWSYAYRLARYITDPSTIRAHTLNVYGRAPFPSDIKAMIAEHRKPRRGIDVDPTVAITKEYRRTCSACGTVIDRANKSGLCRKDYNAQHAAEKKAATVKVPLDAIMRSACKVFRMPMRDLLGDGRQRTETDARRAIIYLARGEHYSNVAIGEALRKNVSTIIEARKAAEAAYGRDDIFTARVRAVWANVAELA
jgi:hypothetical protein